MQARQVRATGVLAHGGRGALVLVSTSYPRWTDGREAAGSFVADIAAELAKHGPVRVVAPGDDDSVEPTSNGVTIYRYRAPRKRLVNLRAWNPLEAWRILQTVRTGQAATNRAVSDGKVRHVLALWALPSGAWAQRAASQMGIKYSVWMLGSDIWSLGRLPGVRQILRKVMRGALHRYADGLGLADDSRAICDAPVVFLPSTRELHTKDPSRPSITPPFKLVFIGRWHKNKGVDLMLDALAMLGDADWRAISEVNIYGGGPLHANVYRKIQLLKDAGRPLAVGGFITKAEAEAAIVRADYVLIPSRIESIPVIFSDAMKLDRPVITTPVGDLPRLVQRDVGVVCKTVDAASYAQSIRIAIHSPIVDRGAIATCAEMFSLPSIAKRILADAASS